MFDYIPRAFRYNTWVGCLVIYARDYTDYGSIGLLLGTHIYTRIVYCAPLRVYLNMVVCKLKARLLRIMVRTITVFKHNYGIIGVTTKLVYWHVFHIVQSVWAVEDFCKKSNE